MNLLALDTSTEACSVALLVNDEMMHRQQEAARQHAAILFPMIDELLGTAGVRRSELDGIVYGRGPGSFTGVRVGVAAAQGLALGLGIGVMGVSSLQAVAQHCLQNLNERKVLVSLDARMDEVYVGAYRADEHNVMQPVAAEQVCAPADILQRIGAAVRQPDESAGHWFWAGTGAARYESLLTDDLNIPSTRINGQILPQAVDMIRIAAEPVRQGLWQDPADAVPVYLRDKVALTTEERQSARSPGRV